VKTTSIEKDVNDILLTSRQLHHQHISNWTAEILLQVLKVCRKKCVTKNVKCEFNWTSAVRQKNPTATLDVVSMGVRRKFSRVATSTFRLSFFRLRTMQCKWTFTRRLTLSTPQKNFPMKVRAPFAFFEIIFMWSCIRIWKMLYFLSSFRAFAELGYYPISLLLWTADNQYEFYLNYPQLLLQCSHKSVWVELTYQNVVWNVFYTLATRNAFAFHKLLNIHFSRIF